MKLDEIKPEQECTILDILLEGAELQRLLDMGFIEGTCVKVIRNAPLMDPLDIEIRGYLIALRRHEAKGVEVTLR
ncbi:MAG: ferrous iron transport protein A [Candidatus Vecturithrix sp.]|jgi:Fe2+ transport system protein FeoA|nr:ferrous iron transport protein A [Candidatus Vecturithrix sp.]